MMYQATIYFHFKLSIDLIAFNHFHTLYVFLIFVTLNDAIIVACGSQNKLWNRKKTSWPRGQIRQTDSNADKDGGTDKRDNNAYLQTVGKHLKSQ